MPRRRVFAASANRHHSSWMGRLAEFAELGTGSYPPLIRRQLMIVNVMAFMIAIFSLFYAVLFALYGLEIYLSLVIANLVLVGVALLTPLAHRVSDICAALIIATAEYVALFFFVRALGHDSGIQINYMVAAAIPFAIFGLSRLWLVIAAIATGLALHLAVWFLYPTSSALIAPDPALLNNLYISSVITTGCIIAVIVLYAFSLADDARAEADALLTSMLPESIAERLKASPGELLAGNVENASVLFTDLVGFTPLAGVIGADRFSYDVWGETVNLASQLESHGLPGQVHVSGEVKRALRKSFHFEPRGRIEIKGVGHLETWMLKHEKT